MRKTGLRDGEYDGARLYDSSHLKKTKSGNVVVIPDIPIYFHNQGKTNACSAFGTTHAMNHEITQLTQHQSGVSPWDLWKLQVATKPSVEKDGDTFARCFMLAEEYGFDDVVSKRTYIPKIYRIKKTPPEIMKILDAEKPIITGVYCLWPFVDKNYVWRVNTTGGGHCVAIIGYDKNYLYAINSWEEFGIKIGAQYTGVFEIRWEDIIKTMGMYVLEIDYSVPFQI